MENHHAKLHPLFTGSIHCETTDELQGLTGRREREYTGLCGSDSDGEISWVEVAVYM